MREMLGRKPSSKLKKDLDEISEKIGVREARWRILAACINQCPRVQLFEATREPTENILHHRGTTQ
mgnify:CR=1 FL=1